MLCYFKNGLLGDINHILCEPLRALYLCAEKRQFSTENSGQHEVSQRAKLVICYLFHVPYGFSLWELLKSTGSSGFFITDCVCAGFR
jgi:hypothetical protein